MNIEHFALNVPDPASAAAWYESHLGMRVVRAVNNAPFARFLADESEQVVVELYHRTDASVPDYRAMDPLVFHIAFVTPDVRAEPQRLLAAWATPAGHVAVTPAVDEMALV